jgi:hypothetical protein
MGAIPNATFSAHDHCLCAGLPTDRKVGLALEDDFRPFPWRRSHQGYTSRRFARGRQHGVAIESLQRLR